MGMYNLVFFISGAFGSTIAGKILDYSGVGTSWNPLAVAGGGAIYSNLFLALLVVILISLSVFFAAFPSRRRVLSEVK